LNLDHNAIPGLLIALLCGGITGAIAGLNQRSTWKWALGGMAAYLGINLVPGIHPGMIAFLIGPVVAFVMPGVGAAKQVVPRGTETAAALPPKYHLTRSFWTSLVVLVLGSGPLLVFLVFSEDPRANPVGLGMIAGVTFWPCIIFMLWELWSSFRLYRAQCKQFRQRETTSLR
jgi:hypothetical protein